MQTFQTILNYLQDHWPAILSLIGGGAGVSVLLEIILKKLHIDSKKLAFTLLHLTSLVTTVAIVILANMKQFSALPIYGSLVIFAETWNRFVISPAYNKVVVPYLEYLEGKKPQFSTAASVSVASNDEVQFPTPTA